MKYKTEHHDAIRERAREAIRDLYHNATPNHPCADSDEERQAYEGWFSGAAEFEIKYLSDGGAYGNNYSATLRHPANAGKYKSEKARAYYVRNGLQKMREERADCGMLTGWGVLELAAGNRKLAKNLRAVAQGRWPLSRNNAQWERITEFGKMYQWGRGGRTLAPDKLIHQGGGSSFSVNEGYPNDMPIADVVDLIRIIESFNHFVRAWCESVPEQWADVWAEQCAELKAEKLADLETAARQLESDRPDMYGGAHA